MKSFFYYIFAFVLALGFVSCAPGQNLGGWTSEGVEGANNPDESDEPDLSRPRIFSITKCLGKSKNGYATRRCIIIEYPWSKIQNASLEVRIIGPEAENQPQFCNPAYFMTIYGKLEQIDKDIFNKKIGAPGYRYNIEYSRALFHEYGLPEPESLFLASIKPLSGARADFFHMVLNNPETNELETTLVFHDLSQWAIDDDRLAIELRGLPIPGNPDGTSKDIEFEKPCKIKIWLLHDDFVVWEATFQWPGTEKDRPVKSGGSKRKASKNDKDDEDPRVVARQMEDENKAQKADKEDEEFEGFEEDL